MVTTISGPTLSRSGHEKTYRARYTTGAAESAITLVSPFGAIENVNITAESAPDLNFAVTQSIALGTGASVAVTNLAPSSNVSIEVKGK